MKILKDSAKAKIDAMSLDELVYQIELGRKSPYQGEKMAYIKTRCQDLWNPEQQINIETYNHNKWYQRPLGIIAITVLSGFIVLCLAYIFRKHFGISL